ncbi:hypothetical protein, partial [Rothia mucilaginosa]|uniref:hypothetical protein n=1 Tax=Rothia mucilaginosa TaxID=43675 RepID=UPI0026E98963
RFKGAKKSPKNFQKPLKICEYPSPEPKNWVERPLKPSHPRTRKQQNDTRRAPPDGGALRYLSRSSRDRKRGCSPTDYSAEKHPLYV